MSAHYSQDTEASNSRSETLNSENQRGSSSGNLTPNTSSEQTTPQSPSTETSAKSTSLNSNESTSSQEASPAKTSASPEKAQALKLARALVYGMSLRERLGNFDQSSSSLRTSQQSLTGDWILYSETLPRSGMMQSGVVYRLPALAPLTAETESSSSPTPARPTWATPNAQMQSEMTPERAAELGWVWKGTAWYKLDGTKKNSFLTHQINMFPTPTASDGTTGSILSEDDEYYLTANGAARKVNRNGVDGSLGLGRYVLLETFPTPTARDWKGMQANEYKQLRGEETTHKFSSLPGVVMRGQQSLSENGQMCRALSASGAMQDLENEYIPNSPRQSDRTLVTAAAQTSSLQSRGQLNPDWVERLMGVPDGWTMLSPEQAQAYLARKKMMKKKDYIDSPPPIQDLPSRSAEIVSWSSDWEAGIPRITQKREFRVERLKMLGNGVVPAWACIPVYVIKELLHSENSNG